MTLPVQSDVHVNVPLTNMSVAFMQDLKKFRADDAAPLMPSEKKTNAYFTFDKEFWFRDELKIRGPGATGARVGYGITPASFTTDVWSAGKAIDDQVRANEDVPLNSDRNSMQLLTRLERIRREKSFNATFMLSTAWTTTYTGVPGAPGALQVKQWDQATSTPLEDIANLITVMEILTGMTPNILCIGALVWKILKNHAEIINRVTGGANNGSPAMVTRELVAMLFGLDELIVFSAVENTAAQGIAFNGAYIVGKVGLLMYRDASAGIEVATACRTITWRQYAAGTSGTRILKWRDENIHSDVIEIESAFGHKVIAPDLGIFLTALVG